MAFLAVLIPIAITLIIIKLALSYYKLKHVYRKYDFPGPKGVPFLGQAFEFRGCKDILPVSLKYMKKYGLNFRINIGGTEMLFTGDPKLLEIILTSQTLLTKSLGVEYLKNWIGQGLITTGNPRWKIHRRLITPTFHFRILEDFIPIFNRNALNFIRHLKKYKPGQEINFAEDALLCTLDTICETAMGTKVNALEGHQNNYIESIKYMGEMTMERIFSFWMQYHWLFRMSSEYRKEQQMKQYVNELTDHVIKTRREEYRQRPMEKDNSEEIIYRKQRAAFLDHLIASSEENGGFVTNEQIREEVQTFMFAGHDTVASSLAFTLYFLAKHQDVQKKAYEEITSVLGDKMEVTYEQLPELKYLECVIKESLRLCPSVPMHSRVLTEDVTYGDKIIPKGINIVIFHFGAHRNEELFPNAEEFIPERFLEEDFSKKILYTYLPFNAGPRNCIGRKYSMFALKCMLSLLIKEFRFSKRDDFRIEPVAEQVLKSSTGVFLKIETR